MSNSRSSLLGNRAQTSAPGQHGVDIGHHHLTSEGWLTVGSPQPRLNTPEDDYLAVPCATLIRLLAWFFSVTCAGSTFKQSAKYPTQCEQHSRFHTLACVSCLSPFVFIPAQRK